MKLFEKGLRPAPPADRRTLIRRVTYDLTGLPPTPEEVDAFVADSSPVAYERLVDRLLASPHYGERWGRHWLDVVRFGESVGFERNIIIDNAWPFRDHVIRSFNADKPFDQLVLDHLAGDVIGRGDPAVEVGTGFLVCGAYDNVKNLDPLLTAQNRANEIDDMIRATSEAFLGLTIGCARCHNHKFDPILQRDYYSLQATFAGVTHAQPGGRHGRSPPRLRGECQVPAGRTDPAQRRADPPRGPGRGPRRRARPGVRSPLGPPAGRAGRDGRDLRTRRSAVRAPGRDGTHWTTRTWPPATGSTSSRSGPRATVRGTSPWRPTGGRPPAPAVSPTTSPTPTVPGLPSTVSSPRSGSRAGPSWRSRWRNPNGSTASCSRTTAASIARRSSSGSPSSGSTASRSRRMGWPGPKSPPLSIAGQ